MPSPTEKSLALLRAQGYTAEVVERWLPRANVRKDLFGFIDLIAMHGNSGILAIQTTTLSSYRQHVTKLQEKAMLIKQWLTAGGFFRMHCWGTGSRGGKPYKRLRVSVAFLKPKTGQLEWQETEYVVGRGYTLEERE